MPAVKDGFSTRTTKFEHLTFLVLFEIIENGHTMVPFYESVLQVQCRSWKKTDCLYFDRPFFWVPLLSSIRCQSFFCSVWLVRKANQYMQTSMIHNHQHGSEPIFQLDLSHAGLSFSFRHAGVGLPGKMLWLLVLVQFGSLGPRRKVYGTWSYG